MLAPVQLRYLAHARHGGGIEPDGTGHGAGSKGAAASDQRSGKRKHGRTRQGHERHGRLLTMAGAGAMRTARTALIASDAAARADAKAMRRR